MLWAEFEAIRPHLFGALLDELVGALREEPSVRLPSLPRMADFAVWAVAAERGRGAPARFLAAYGGLHAVAYQQALEGSAVGVVLLAWLPGATSLDPWSGTAEDLLTELAAASSEAARRNKAWPKTPRGLRSELTRLAPALRGIGYQIEFDQREGHERRRLLVITRASASDEEPTDAEEPVATTTPEPGAAGPSAPSAERVKPNRDREHSADGRASVDGPQPTAWMAETPAPPRCGRWCGPRRDDCGRYGAANRPRGIRR